MKEHLRQLASTAENDLARTCLVREYLQARILESLQDTGIFLRWAFVGGTALRFLFSIPRFPEDLDFSLIDPGKDADFKSAASEVKRMFEREGYSIDVKVSEKKTVASAWVRFPGLPHEVGISSHAAQVLSIKLRLDTNPPAGAHIENSVVRRHVTLNLCHYDKASLLAGKIHAVLSRQWTKGRATRRRFHRHCGFDQPGRSLLAVFKETQTHRHHRVSGRSRQRAGCCI
jgi:hypothetical protein